MNRKFLAHANDKTPWRNLIWDMSQNIVVWIVGGGGDDGDVGSDGFDIPIGLYTKTVSLFS